MPQQDTSQLKERIISIIRTKGPTIPSAIASEIQTSILFASAFLSELLSEKKLKTSHMRFGSSPIYFIPGQEFQLEKFSHHLKSKEKDAFILLKEKKFLKDINQEPAIRVALRSIRDFAVPFKKGDEIFWRYFTIPESEFQEPKNISQKIQEPLTIQKQISASGSEQEISSQGREGGEAPKSQKEKPLNIFDKENKKPGSRTESLASSSKNVERKKKTIRKKPTPKVNEKFFNKVKEHLTNNQIEILDILSFSKNDITLKISENNQEKLLVAYNKKSVREDDILKANKKAQELNLPYTIISIGEPLKKLNNLIQAIQNLNKIEKIKEN